MSHITIEDTDDHMGSWLAVLIGERCRKKGQDRRSRTNRDTTIAPSAISTVFFPDVVTTCGFGNGGGIAPTISGSGGISGGGLEFLGNCSSGLVRMRG
jgi:hypothetical protein